MNSIRLRCIKFGQAILTIALTFSSISSSHAQLCDNPPVCGVVCEENSFRQEPPVLGAQAELILPDNVLRIYRLAILVDYSAFVHHFGSSTQEVHKYWDEAEKALNTLYTRDLGIRMELVRDDKLIRTASALEVFNNYSIGAIVRSGTSEINQIISTKDYDLGVVIVRGRDTDAVGLAQIDGAYKLEARAAACVRGPGLDLLAHEIGHLFGSDHTFSLGGGTSYATEVDKGQSIMSYGSPRTFFSLVSVSRIRRNTHTLPYYSDAERKHLVGTHAMYNNFPYGIPSTSVGPKLDRQRLKASYKLPKGTDFAFRLSNDAEAANAYYVAQPADVRTRATSNAQFLTFAPSANGMIPFERTYGSTGTEIAYTGNNRAGMFTFWLGALNKSEEHTAALYDVLETKVEVVEGKPFVVRSLTQPIYKTGERIRLNWDVDTRIFPSDSKVRILLSTDFGKTYPHILHPYTDNDGECDVYIPQINIGTIPYLDMSTEIPAGVIKVEVIDHIAYALTEHRPAIFSHGRSRPWGGFRVNPAPLTFSGLSKDMVYLEITDGDELPNKPTVTASTTCSRGRINVDYTVEEIQGNLENKWLLRKWTATDACGNSSVATQLICIKPRKKQETPPTTSEETSPGTTALETVKGQHPAFYHTVGQIHYVDYQPSAVLIYDMSGRLHKRYGAGNSYDLGALASGMYIVRAWDVHGVQRTDKIMIC